MIRRHYENCYVTLYPHGGDAVRLGPDMRPNPLLQVSFSKEVVSLSGTVSMTLRWTPQLAKLFPGRTLLDVLADDDWFRIRGGDRGDLFDVTLGLVDTISEHVTVANGARIVEYTITGRDIGKVLDETEIWFCEFGKNANYNGKAALGLLSWNETGSPDAICKLLIDGFLSPGYSTATIWELPASLACDTQPGSAGIATVGNPSARDILDTTSFIGALRGLGIIRATINTQMSLSQQLHQWSHPILNELFTDMRVVGGRPQPVVVMRERPFPVHQEVPTMSAWQNIPSVPIYHDEVMATSLSRSGQERFTAFSLLAETDPAGVLEQYALHPPRIVVPGIRIHGLRKHEVSTLFGSYVRTGEMRNEVRRWAWLLHSWYGCNADLLSGTINVRGFNPCLRVGRKLVLGHRALEDPQRLTAYIEGVSLAWSAQGGWQTTVGVTRGYRGDDSVMYGLIRKHFEELSYVAELSEDSGLLRTDALLPSPDRLETSL